MSKFKSVSACFRFHESESRRSKRYQRRADSRFTPKVESLEARRLLAATIFEVTNTEDSGPGSLRAAIGSANTNPGADIIQFAKGVRGKIKLDPSNGALTIVDDLAIAGPGAQKLTVSGQNLTRVFSVLSLDPTAPIDVEIQGLGIANGLASDAPGFPDAFGFAFGGGLYNLASHVSLVGVKMVRNQAGSGAGTSIAAGGAIANEFGGSIEVVGSHFSRNTAIAQTIAAGGAITQDIGPSLDPSGNPGNGTDAPSMTVERSSFRHNAAIALESDPAAAGDFAPFAGFAFGGAITNLAGEATVVHSSFSHNRVESGAGVNGHAGGTAVGGAIFSDDFSPFDAVPPPGRDAFINVSHSHFVHNSAIGGDGDVTGNGGAANGGALGASISFFHDSGTIAESVFRHNTAIGGDGGSAGGTGGSASGGAIAVLAGADLTVSETHLRHNTVRGGRGGQGADGGEARGGAIGLNRLVTAFPPDLFDELAPMVTVTHSSLVHNRVVGGVGGEGGGNGGDGNGGGIGVGNDGIADVSYSLIAHNQAVGGRARSGSSVDGNGRGGGIYNDATSTVTIVDSEIARNRAKGGQSSRGGGVFSLGTLNIDDVDTIFANRASGDCDDLFDLLGGLCL